ncbi:hypothetical protein FRC02_012363 [Tulasnella sp. 418]|nr:hypothetical protein FRC02_012363 [Tulasnella sp. 418]
MLMLETAVSPGQASVIKSAIAIFDRLTGRKSRERDPKALIPKNKHPDSLWYSIEMMYHYQALKHPLKLHLCMEEWRKFIPVDQVVLNYDLGFISTSNSPPSWSGRSSSWSFSLVPRGTNNIYGHGNTNPIEGAFYEFINSSTIEGRPLKTVIFMTLSSYVADHTKDPGILKLAIQSATCVKTYLLDSTKMLIKEHSDLNGNNRSGPVSCHLTGIVIEGFSVLGAVSGDAEWKRLAVEIAEAAMRARDWHGDNGILTVPTDGTLYINKDVKAFKGMSHIKLSR